ncbi:MAG: restriction endonuclease [Propionicimonas sp.]|uniref:restriction endonuclease n=1 Tax=Propionicimonas sp. TaxID=1955623 RepID=UPI003D12680D
MTSAWVVRGGSRGEHEQWNLERGRATIGWAPIGDLAGCSSRGDVQVLVDGAYAGNSAQSRGMQTGQLWAFRHSIQPGDLLVMPLKSRQGYVALGRCGGRYGYDASADQNRRHFLPVEWQPEPVSKTVLKDDLLATLNGMMTVFAPSRNGAIARLEQVWARGSDPGLTGASFPPPSPSSEADAVSDPPAVPTLDAIRDRIRTRIVESFGGHKLTQLVADILTALGYGCEVSPPGPDGGIDIRAGRGPLGLDTLTIVEVKSQPSPVDVFVVRGLHSAIGRTSATQGLLVAMGGLNSPARKEWLDLRSTIQVWDSEVLLEKLFETYPRLSEATRATLPLKQAWVLDDEAEG